MWHGPNGVGVAPMGSPPPNSKQRQSIGEVEEASLLQYANDPLTAQVIAKRVLISSSPLKETYKRDRRSKVTVK